MNTIKVEQNKKTISKYVKIFGPGLNKWKPDLVANIQFLNELQCYFNVILKTKGFVFLNDVYEELDIPKTRAGQCAGWVYDSTNPDDNFIDFVTSGVKYVNGEYAIILDFNVNEDILDKAS